MMIHLKLIIMSFLYAGGFIAGKVAITQAGPFSIAFTRFFISTSILSILIYRNESKGTFTKSMLLTAMGAAFLGVFCYNFLFLTGVKYVEAGRGSIIVSTVPIIVSLISVLFLKEESSFMKSLGIILSIVGAWVVITRGHLTQVFLGPLGLGEICMLGCVLCAVAFTFFSRKMLRHLSPMMTMMYISGIGTLFLFGPALLEMQSGMIPVLSYSLVFSLLYLAIGPSIIGVVFYYQAINTVGASRATQYMNLMPVFAIVLAVIFLGEHITFSVIMGSGLVTTGLYLSNLNK